MALGFVVVVAVVLGFVAAAASGKWSLDGLGSLDGLVADVVAGKWSLDGLRSQDGLVADV